MYKILLCYAQTHKYIIYIERDCVRDKALLYKKEEETFRRGWQKHIRKKYIMRRRKSFSKEKQKEES
jgi:hypothetical protein